MKRLFAVLLVLCLTVGLLTPVLAEPVVQEKMTKTDKRVQAYLLYLKGLFEDESKITYVGIADIDKDNLPELFYVSPEDGESFYHFCGYADNEVFEYDIAENSLGRAPGSLSLKRYREKNNNNHCWALRATTTKANSEKRYEYIAYVFTRSGTSVDSYVKFRRTWKSGKKDMLYYVDEEESLKSIYEQELYDFFTAKRKRAETTTYKNVGIIKKVSAQKWSAIKGALNTASLDWKDSEPMTE